MEKRSFNCIYCSNEHVDHPFNDLFNSSQSGWISKANPKYPIKAVIDLKGDFVFKEMQIVSHESMITTRIDIFISNNPNLDGIEINSDNYFEYRNQFNWKNIGYFGFTSNERSNWVAREYTKVALQGIQASYIMLSIYECYRRVPGNAYKQVSIVSLKFIGTHIYRPRFGLNLIDMFNDLVETKKSAIQEENFALADLINIQIENTKKNQDILNNLFQKKQIALENEEFLVVDSIITQIFSILNQDIIPRQVVQHEQQQNQQNQKQNVQNYKIQNNNKQSSKSSKLTTLQLKLMSLAKKDQDTEKKDNKSTNEKNPETNNNNIAKISQETKKEEDKSDKIKKEGESDDSSMNAKTQKSDKQSSSIKSPKDEEEEEEENEEEDKNNDKSAKSAKKQEKKTDKKSNNKEKSAKDFEEEEEEDDSNNDDDNNSEEEDDDDENKKSKKNQEKKNGKKTNDVKKTSLKNANNIEEEEDENEEEDIEEEEEDDDKNEKSKKKPKKKTDKKTNDVKKTSPKNAKNLEEEEDENEEEEDEDDDDKNKKSKNKQAKKNEKSSSLKPTKSHEKENDNEAKKSAKNQENKQPKSPSSPNSEETTKKTVDPLTDEAIRESEQLIELFGEETIAAVYSENWEVKSNGLVTLCDKIKQLNNKESQNTALLSMFPVLHGMFSSNLKAIYVQAVEQTISLIDELNESETFTKFPRKMIRQLLNLSLSKLSNTHHRINEASMKFVKWTSKVDKSLMVEIAQFTLKQSPQATPLLDKNKIELLNTLINENENLLTNKLNIKEVMQFFLKCLESPSKDVRKNAIILYKNCYSAYGKKVKKYIEDLPKTIKKELNAAVGENE